MSEMLDRVARAITEYEGPEWDNEGRARAAIEAMRDPTAAMAAKACNALKRHIELFRRRARSTLAGSAGRQRLASAQQGKAPCPVQSHDRRSAQGAAMKPAAATME